MARLVATVRGDNGRALSFRQFFASLHARAPTSRGIHATEICAAATAPPPRPFVVFETMPRSRARPRSSSANSFSARARREKRMRESEWAAMRNDVSRINWRGLHGMRHAIVRLRSRRSLRFVSRDCIRVSVFLSRLFPPPFFFYYYSPRVSQLSAFSVPGFSPFPGSIHRHRVFHFSPSIRFCIRATPVGGASSLGPRRRDTTTGVEAFSKAATVGIWSACVSICLFRLEAAELSHLF